MNKPNNVGSGRTSHNVKFSKFVAVITTATATASCCCYCCFCWCCVVLNYVIIIIIIVIFVENIVVIAFSCCKSFRKSKQPIVKVRVEVAENDEESIV